MGGFHQRAIRNLQVEPSGIELCHRQGFGDDFDDVASSKGPVSLAQELPPGGVRVNALAPGVIATPMTEVMRSDPARLEAFLSRIAMGCVGQMEDFSIT